MNEIVAAISVKNPVSTAAWDYSRLQLKERFPQIDIDRLYFVSLPLSVKLPEASNHLPHHLLALYLWSKIKNCSPTTQRRWRDIILSCKIFHNRKTMKYGDWASCWPPPACWTAGVRDRRREYKLMWTPVSIIHLNYLNILLNSH